MLKYIEKNIDVTLFLKCSFYLFKKDITCSVIMTKDKYLRRRQIKIRISEIGDQKISTYLREILLNSYLSPTLILEKRSFLLKITLTIL